MEDVTNILLLKTSKNVHTSMKYITLNLFCDPYIQLAHFYYLPVNPHPIVCHNQTQTEIFFSCTFIGNLHSSKSFSKFLLGVHE